MEDREKRELRRGEEPPGWGGPPDEHEHLPEHRLTRAGMRVEKTEAEGYATEAPAPAPRTGAGACPMCGSPLKAGARPGEGPHRGKGPAHPTDERTKAYVELALTEDPWLDASQVTVVVREGAVTLAGTVAASGDVHRAEEDARRIFGVKGVQNNLRTAGAE